MLKYIFLMHNMMEKKKILIVGGAGFVGSNLVNKLLEKNINKIVVVDNLLSSEKNNLPVNKKIKFIKGSITNDKIFKKVGIDYDYVFHLATYHGNQSSMLDPLMDHQNNTLTTLKLCEHFKNSNIKKFVYSSAGCVVAKKTYEEAYATQEDQGVSLYLDTPYQMSKIFGEFYGNYYFKQYNLPFVKARFQNVYGPGEILGAGKWRGSEATIWRNVVPTFIWKCLNNIPIDLHNNGNTSRDFIFVDDIVNGLILCALNGKSGEVYNLASGKEIKIKELAETIRKITGSRSEFNLYPKREWDNSGKRFGDPKKAKTTINFEAKINLEIGIKKTVEWTIKNKKIIKRNILKHKKNI